MVGAGPVVPEPVLRIRLLPLRLPTLKVAEVILLASLVTFFGTEDLAPFARDVVSGGGGGCDGSVQG